MTWKNKLDLLTQSGQGRKERGTLEYDDGYHIEQPRDLITKEFVDILFENLPPDAESLQSKVLLMSGTVLKSGYLAQDVAASYETGKGAGSQVDYIINDPTFVLATPNTETAVNKGDQGTLELWRNYSNADGTLISDKLDEFDLAVRFDESLRTTSQTGLPANSPLGKITVTHIDKYSISKYQKVNAFVSVLGSDLKTGYNELVLKHTGTTGGDQVSAAYKVFYDVATNTPAITDLDVTLQTVAPKWLSGVQYAGLGTTVLVDAVGNALYDNTYVQDPITLTGFHGMPDTVIAPNDGSVSGLSNPPKTTEVMTVNDKIVTLSVSGQATLDGKVTATPKDPHGTYSASISPSHKYLINTFMDDDTGTIITFNSEKRRLPLSWNVLTNPSSTNNFNSQTPVAGTSELEVGITANNENGLLYPSRDYRAYLPANTQNLSAETGNKQALFFITSPASYTDIVMTLEGLNGGLGADVIVELKLGNNQTGWLRTDLPYDSALGVMADGLGCLIGAVTVSGGNTTFKANFGGKNTFAAGMTMFIRFTYKNGMRVINKLVTNW